MPNISTTYGAQYVAHEWIIKKMPVEVRERRDKYQLKLDHAVAGGCLPKWGDPRALIRKLAVDIASARRLVREASAGQRRGGPPPRPGARQGARGRVVLVVQSKR